MNAAPLAELRAALQPFVDASLQSAKLRAHLPRLSAALEALEADTPAVGGEGSPKTSPVPKNAAPRQSARAALALEAVDRGEMNVSEAARHFGVAASTLFRARAKPRALSSAKPKP